MGKEQVRRLALERIWRLFDVAGAWADRDAVLSRTCISSAMQIRSRFRVRFPPELQLRYCKRCKGYLKPDCIVRTLRWIELACPHCHARFKRKPPART